MSKKLKMITARFLVGMVVAVLVVFMGIMINPLHESAPILNILFYGAVSTGILMVLVRVLAVAIVEMIDFLMDNF
jgi:hypothetical protein